MNIAQLESLTEDERSLLFYIVNVVSPMTCPKMEFDMNSIKWMRHDMLLRKLLDVLPKMKPEGHQLFVDMMQKLGVKVEISPTPQPQPEMSSSAQIV